MRINWSLTLLLLSGCYLSEPVPEDQTTWAYERPHVQGITESNLFDLDARIRRGAFENISSVLAISDDKMIFENHFLNGERNQVQNIDRLTLICSQIAIGIAIKQGLIEDLDVEVHTLLPEYADIFNEDPDKRAILLTHLFTNTSGLSWNEALYSAQSENNDLNIMKEETDFTRFVLEKELSAPPGFRYGVNTGSGMILSAIIESVSGLPLDVYLDENLFSYLDITERSWEVDPSGKTNGATGLSISSFDLTKLGYLYLKEGLWKNQEIFDLDFHNASTKMQLEVTERYGIGYYWSKLSDSYNSDLLGQNINDVYFMIGQNGDAVFISPQKRLVVSIFANNPFYGFYNPSLYLFQEFIESIE